MKRDSRRSVSIPFNQDVTTSNQTFYQEFMWNPFSLRFNGRHEIDFQNTHYCAVRHEQDLIGHITGMFIGPLFLSSLYSSLPAWYIAIWILISFGFAPLSIYLILYQKSFYKKHRTLFVMFIRTVVNIFETGFSLYFPLHDNSILEILRALFTKSPCVNMFFIPMSLRLTFTAHLQFQFVMLGLAQFWIRPFCDKCSTSTTASRFQQIGSGLNNIFSPSLIEIQFEDTQFPCWMICTFVFVLLGWIIPTYLVFTSEISARAAYLKTRHGQTAYSEIEEYESIALKVAILASLVLTLIVWMVLSSINESFRPNGQ